MLEIERLDGITSHCETFALNSECHYLELGCMGCMMPAFKSYVQAIPHIIEDLRNIQKRIDRNEYTSTHVGIKKLSDAIKSIQDASK